MVLVTQRSEGIYDGPMVWVWCAVHLYRVPNTLTLVNTSLAILTSPVSSTTTIGRSRGDPREIRCLFSTRFEMFNLLLDALSKDIGSAICIAPSSDMGGKSSARHYSFQAPHGRKGVHWPVFFSGLRPKRTASSAQSCQACQATST